MCFQLTYLLLTDYVNVIVRFTNRRTRDRVYNARRELRNMSTRIFINEDLNQSTNKLFFHARHLVKSRRIHSAWTYTGNVFVKETSANQGRSGVLGGAEHPRAAGAAPVLRMARSTPS